MTQDLTIYFNETNGASDHNVIGVEIATKDIKAGEMGVEKL